MLQIPFISTIGDSHSDHSVSNALGERTGEREREWEVSGEYVGGLGEEGVEREERELPPDISHMR